MTSRPKDFNKRKISFLVLLVIIFCVVFIVQNSNTISSWHVWKIYTESLPSEDPFIEKFWKSCNKSLNHNDFGMNLTTFNGFKRNIAKQFIRENANPFPKSKTPLHLETFEKKYTPPPNTRLKFPGEAVNNDEIDKNLQEEKDRRLKLGDDDPLKIKEVQEEMENSLFKVPNIIHFVWFSCHKFHLLNYVCMLSSFRYQKPKLILFHTNCEPEGEYWNVLKYILGDTLKIVRRSPPEKVWGIRVGGIEHRADVTRLRIELEIGGTYLDSDVAVLKQFDDLRKHKMVLAEEQEDGLTNCIIIANRNAWFLRRWYWEYKNFHDERWGFNSVLVPWAIAKLFPDKIFVVKELLSRPNYREVSMIYRELYDWRRNYMMHLYARLKKSHDGKSERSVKELAILNTTYGQIARHIIWGNEKPRNIIDLLVTCNTTQILLDGIGKT